MKLISLLRFQYSRYCIKELALMVLISFITIALLGSVAPILYVLSMNRLMQEALPAQTIYFYPSTRISNLLTASPERTEEVESISAYLEQINRSKGAIGIGRTAEWYVQFDDSVIQQTRYVAYNEDMVSFTSVPLHAGQWLDTSVPTGYVPIIIGGAYREQQSITIGDILQLWIPSSNEYCNYEGYVVGILNSDDMFLTLSYGATEPDMESIAVQYRWADNSALAHTDAIVLLPADILGNEVNIQYTPGSLLFFDDQEDYEMLSEKEKYGTYATQQEMLEAQIKTTLRRNNNDIAATIALVLFAAIGLSGYSVLNVARQARMISIYRACGMSRIAGMFLQLTSAAILVIVPSSISLTQIPNYMENYAKVCEEFYVIYVLLLILVLIPSTIFILSDYCKSRIVQKEDMQDAYSMF